jgi:hypothetical protein
MKTLIYWTVENTGWSGGVSWFKTGGTEANPLRFNSPDAAFEYALNKKGQLNDPDTLWRVVHTKVVTEENSQVTTKVWVNV